MAQEQDLKLKKYLKISLGIHLGLLVLSVAGPWIFPTNPIRFTPTVQIDMVALPNQVKQDKIEPIDTSLPIKDKEPPAEEPNEPEKSEPKESKATKESVEKDEVALPKENKKAAKQAKSAIEKLKEQLKKEREEAEKKKSAQINQRKENLKKFEEKYRAAIRGNQTNQGSSAQGEMQATTDAYRGNISDILRSNWALPVYLQTQGLRATVRIYIDSNGSLVRFQFMQNSGNDAFDEYVKITIQKSNKFAPPPEEMARGLRNSGIEVLFPL